MFITENYNNMLHFTTSLTQIQPHGNTISHFV